MRGRRYGAWETAAVDLPDHDAIRQALPEEATGAPKARDFTLFARLRGEIASAPREICRPEKPRMLPVWQHGRNFFEVAEARAGYSQIRGYSQRKW